MFPTNTEHTSPICQVAVAMEPIWDLFSTHFPAHIPPCVFYIFTSLPSQCPVLLPRAHIMAPDAGNWAFWCEVFLQPLHKAHFSNQRVANREGLFKGVFCTHTHKWKRKTTTWRQNQPFFGYRNWWKASKALSTRMQCMCVQSFLSTHPDKWIKAGGRPKTPPHTVLHKTHPSGVSTNSVPHFGEKKVFHGSGPGLKLTGKKRKKLGPNFFHPSRRTTLKQHLRFALRCPFLNHLPPCA